MRILFLHTLFHPHVVGGAEIVLRSQARLLQERGHEVAIAALGPEPGIREETVEGLKVFRCGHRNRYFHYVKDKPPVLSRMLWHWKDRYNHAIRESLSRVLDQYRPDAVWCHNLTGWSISAWDEIRAHGIPAVQVLHDLYLLCPNTTMRKGEDNCERPCASCRLLRLGHAKASGKVEAVVGVSGYVLDRVTGNGLFGSTPIRRVLYNVKEGGLPEAPARATRGRTIGYLGSVSASKGLELLLEQFSTLDDGSLTLRIAGKGHERYVAGLRERFPSPNIEFVGFVDPSGFLSSIDIGVVPSLWQDTLPTVVFEMHAMGIPVVGSLRGGIPEMIRHGENGLLFDPDREGDLSRSLLAALERSDWDQGAIRASAARFYEPSAWVAAFEGITREAIEAM